MTDPAAQLGALKTNLAARGILTQLAGGVLAVLNPDGDEQVDTITCLPRASDGGNLWFWNCMSTPIGEADDIVGAALTIVGSLRRCGINV